MFTITPHYLETPQIFRLGLDSHFQCNTYLLVHFKLNNIIFTTFYHHCTYTSRIAMKYVYEVTTVLSRTFL